MRTVILEAINMNIAGQVSETVPVMPSECYCTVGVLDLGGTWAGTSTLSLEHTAYPLNEIGINQSWGPFETPVVLNASGDIFEVEVAGNTGLRVKVVTGGENLDLRVVLRFY